MGACSLDLAAEMKNVAASRGNVNVPLSCEEKKNPTEGTAADNKRAAAVPLPKESPKKTAHGSRDVTTAEPRKQKETGETKEGITTASPQKRPAEKDLANVAALQGKKAKGAPSALESEGQLSPEEEGEIIEELGRQLESSTANTLVAKQPEDAKHFECHRGRWPTKSSCHRRDLKGRFGEAPNRKGKGDVVILETVVPP